MTALKSNAVMVTLDYAVLTSDESDGVRTLQEVDIKAFTLMPTSEGRAAIERKDAATLRELQQESQQVRLEVLLGHDLYADVKARRNGHEPHEDQPETRRVPTDDELRAKAREVGLSLPPRNHG